MLEKFKKFMTKDTEKPPEATFSTNNTSLSGKKEVAEAFQEQEEAVPEVNYEFAEEESMEELEIASPEVSELSAETRAVPPEPTSKSAREYSKSPSPSTAVLAKQPRVTKMLPKVSPKAGESGGKGTIEEAMLANNQAVEFKRLGRRQEAMITYNKAIEIYPEYAIAYYNRAILFGEQAENKAALADYSRSIEIYPQAECFNNRGNLYLQQKDYEKAREDYNQALCLFPNYAEAYHNRAQVSVSQEMWEEALQDFIRASELNPQLQSAYYNIACIHARNYHVEKAVEFLEKALKSGFKDFHKIKEEPDFLTLHDHPALEELLEFWQPTEE